MTENHIEFCGESGVDPSGDVGQKSAHQSDSVLSEQPPEKLPTYPDNHESDLEDGSGIENIFPTEALLSNGCEEESSPHQDLWAKFSKFLKKFYRTISDGKKPPDELEYQVHVVRELVTNDPHQLFARLEMDLHEFILEVKVRQLELVNCVQTEEGPHLFIFCLLEGYNKLMFAAYSLSPLLLQLEVEHLTRFNITWRSLNQHLFHKLIFTDPKIQKVLPICISRLGHSNAELSDFNKRLIRQFLTFDDEMTKVGGRWREAESAIIKYHQENKMQDAKWRMTKVNWDLMQSRTKAFHEELKSSGIPSCLDLEMVNDDSPDGEKNVVDTLSDDGKKTPPPKNTSVHIKTLTDSLKKMKIDLESLQDQQLCDCSHPNAAQSPSSSESCGPEPIVNVKVPKNGISSCEVPPNKEAEILAHLNAEGKKMYSHLHKYKAHQMSSGGKNHTTISNEETSPSQTAPQPSSSPSPESHKTQIRKQVIQQQQQRQQHQKKIMQMMQSSQQKDIQHKIQKQLQEHQLLLQQQRKIDELHAHLLQQRPLAKDAETQKNVHLQVQHRLIQKHKQVEEKFQQQVQQYMQQHQDKQTCASGTGPCSHTKRTIIGTKSTYKCSTTMNSGIAANTAMTTTSSSSSSTTTTTTTSSTVVYGGKTHPSSTNTKLTNSANSTHKNSTTQTSVLTSTVNGEGWYLCPSADGKSTSYVCPKHSDGSTYDLEISSDNSSDDEFDWENSNSPQRHCDCCYCEAFGSAPVSRNFQETRERLRLILTKKKAKSNAANNEKSTDQSVTNGSKCANSQTASQGESKMRKEDGTGDGKAKPPEYKGDRPLQEILDFIEGITRNTKRTAKKMRKKQRQQEEEERRRKEEEEAERQRQEELRRQREEEKRRLEEERKKQELLRKQDRKKNKKQQQQQQQQSVTKTSASSTAQNGSTKKGNNKNQIVSDNAKLAQTKKSGQKTMDKTALQKQVVQQQQQAKSANQAAKKKQEQVKLQQQQSKNAKGQSTVAGSNGTQKKKGEEKTDDDSGQPQMVTIKRVMQPNSSEPTVTITLRGQTPNEDKVLYTLHNGQISPLKEDKQKQSNSSTTNASATASKKKATAAAAAKPTPDAAHISSNHLRPGPSVNVRSSTAPPPPMVTLTNGMYSQKYHPPCDGVNSITERMEKMKLGQPVPIDPSVKKFPSAPAPPPPLAPQPELTTPTAIQINQAVSQLSSRPSFPNHLDLQNIKLPPGITITKVDPATVQRKPIQVKQQAPPPPPPPPPHLRQPMMPSMAPITPITSLTPMSCSPNVIVVDTGDKNDEQGGNGKKKRRRRKKENGEMGQDMASFVNAPPIPPYVPTNGLHSRLNPLGGNMFAGNPFMNSTFGNFSQPPPPQQQQQPAAIIQMNGSMVTIRNPALHQSYGGGAPMSANVPMAVQNAEAWNSNDNNETVFSPPPDEVENNGDVDEYERELEAFKRFCSQSVPAESKAKVNLNIEDIVLKKKGPSVIGCS